ncbi:hypothetical protein BN13_170003 [Nostocoides jenkinsii Ben 74]|uniref:Uncharacterized protein n=1 Tax=Nostocoides jenkinsii Ben 74 TaxID=1193518 RepID=A0A077MC52_9MICO|nr:hypothetical protein BN13_170003 [Tetrasphaera jenkinsii Ben 74]
MLMDELLKVKRLDELARLDA